MRSNIRRQLLTSVVALSAVAFSTSAIAADEAAPQDQLGTESTVGAVPQNEEGGAIVVTGSRIRRNDLTSASPIAVVKAEEFQLSGAVNVEQVINTLPQAAAGSTGFSNNPGSGASTLNLRNLGDTRTLVLVNGRRWMSYDTNQVVDLNTIPQFMIASVDTVTGGQSATYGSDAIAGVVNFNLRQDLDGFLLGGQYSLTEHGDGARYNVDFGFGTSFDDNKGSITVYGNYTRREPIFQDARDFSRSAAGDGCIRPGSTNSSTGIGQNLGGALGTCVSRGGEVGLIPQGSPSGPIGALPGVTAGSPSGYIFNPTGGGTRPFVDPDDLYNFAPDNYLMLPQERYLMGGYANYEVTPGIEAYSEISFVKSTVALELAPTPINQAINLQIASPFFNDQTRGLLRPLDTDGDGYVNSNIGFRFNQSGPRNSEQNRTSFRILGGVRGDITEKLRFDAYYMYARTENQQYQRGNVARSRFGFATETSFAANGSLQCRDAAARAAGCVPLNIFGLNLADPAAIRYVTVNSTNLEKSDVKNFVASINGDLFRVSEGAEPIGFATGVEYRGMSASYTPDTFLASGDVAGFNAGQPTSGDYSVREVFAELRVPLLHDSFVHNLELTGNARYSDYSLGNVGGVWTYAGGVQFAPIRDINFRGQYARAVRAPNVQDLFGGNSVGFPTVQDPCSDRGVAANRTDAIRQFCIASGVPAANVFTRSVQPASQIQANFGGDPNLREETSDTYTAGVVIQPSFIPRLNITVDYFNIKVEDAISTFAGGLNNALQLCYTVVLDMNNPVCSIFQGARNAATGGLGEGAGGLNPDILSANIATLKTSGIDVAVDYSMPFNFSLTGTGSSRVNFSFSGTYLDKFRTTAVASIPEQETIGEGATVLTPSARPMSRWRHNSRLTFSDGPMNLSLRWRYFSGVDDRRLNNTFVGLDRVPQDAALFPNARIGSVSYFDLTTAVQANDNLQITLGVNNLFAQKPEVLGSLQEQANTFPGTYDVLGRDFFVGARLQF